MSECACSCGSDVELPEFYRESFPVARKTYKCCECGEPIKPGEKYHKYVGVWDGIWATYRTCLPCSRIRLDYCAPFGGLFAVFWECEGFDYTRVPEEAKRSE